MISRVIQALLSFFFSGCPYWSRIEDDRMLPAVALYRAAWLRRACSVGQTPVHYTDIGNSNMQSRFRILVGLKLRAMHRASKRG